jgi:acyl carrier protein
MTAQELEAALTQEMRRIAPDIDVAEIDRDGNLREEFDIDSLDFLNLVSALGKRFGIPIPEGDYPRLGSFSGSLAYLAEQTAGKA